MNLYQELGLTPDCTPEQIKQQYRTLAHQHHPDRGGDAEHFKRISLAYEVLSDPIRRQEYDTTGRFDQDNTIRSEALNRISNMIHHYVPSLNSEIEDLVIKMQSDVNIASTQLEQEITNCERTIHNATVAYNRLWVKTNGENILKNFIESLIEQRKNDLKMLTRRRQVFKLILDILDDYHYGANAWAPMLP